MDAKWALAVLMTAALAGCLGGSDDDPDEQEMLVPEDWYMHVTPNLGTDPDHDHGDPTQHSDMTTPDFEILGWDPLSTDYHGAPSGTWYCGETSETEDRALAVINSFDSDIAMVVVDVTDPTQPTMLGELALPLTHIYDSALSDDGRFAILATSPLDTGPDDATAIPGLTPDTYAVRPQWTDACGNTFQGPEDNLPYASGIVLVDLTDPTVPAVADYRPLPFIGAHSISEATVDSTSYVVASATNLVHQVSYFTFYTLEELPAVGGRLVEYGAFTSQYPGQEGIPTDTGRVAGMLVNGHVDATIQKHPVTGDLLAYLANWGGGMTVVELAGPGAILPVSVWDGFGAVHETLPLDELWGDRHITVIGQEGSQQAGATGWVALLDTTDPADPVAVAWWSLPFEELQWDTFLMFSTHYVEVVDRTLFIALYHGGVWAADASEEHWPALPTLGVFIPEPQGEMGVPVTGTLAPEVLDVNALSDGTLVVFDSYSGVFTLRHEVNPGVPVAPALDIEPAWLA